MWQRDIPTDLWQKHLTSVLTSCLVNNRKWNVFSAKIISSVWLCNVRIHQDMVFSDWHCLHNFFVCSCSRPRVRITNASVETSLLQNNDLVDKDIIKSFSAQAQSHFPYPVYMTPNNTHKGYDVVSNCIESLQFLNILQPDICNEHDFFFLFNLLYCFSLFRSGVAQG